MTSSSQPVPTNPVYEYHVVESSSYNDRSYLGCCRSSSMKVVRMCATGILLPILFIALPIYARMVLYASTTVPLTAAGMRRMDSHISTVWCQGQQLRMNVSFDAYLMEAEPSVMPTAKKTSMNRRFDIDDDLKEYWGFYLLKGSKVLVTSCVSNLGASVMLVRGMGSLKYCAYVGSESSEEDVSEVVARSAKNASNQFQSPRNAVDSKSKKDKNGPKQVNVSQSEAGETNVAVLRRNGNLSLDSLKDDVNADEDGAFESDVDEVVLSSDGIADHRGNFDLLDSSESVSSASSSEEALRKCLGVMLSQPLIPAGDKCHPAEPKQNKIKFTVEEDDFYYFVFSSGNEKERSHISVKFELYKTAINVTGATSACRNTTDCTFPLHFASHERVVVSLPLADEFREQNFLIESVCNPRTPLYLVFVLTLPFVVLFWAFH